MTKQEAIIDVDLDFFKPTLKPEESIVICTLTCLAFCFGFLVQRSVFQLLKRKSDRAVNSIIFYQQICLVVFSTFFLFNTANTAVYPIADLVGIEGCFVLDLIMVYGIILNSSMSFYMSLYRYLCLVHGCTLFQSRWLNPRNLAKVIIVCQYIMPLPVYASARLLNEELTPRNADILLICLGRYEMFYNKDVTKSFCDATVKLSWQWWICSTTHVIAFATMSNILESFLLWKCIKVNNSNTNEAKSLLSLSNYKRRQREDKIMFSVNVWQWILELLFQMLAIVQLNFLMGRSKFLDSLWHVFGLFHVQFINAFYLFGDRKFQRHVDENGLLKAIRRALLQMY